MRLWLFLTVILVAGAAARAAAENYAWCSHFADGAGANCGFTSYAQCMETARGSGGYCAPNTMYQPSAAPSHKAAAKPRPRKKP